MDGGADILALNELLTNLEDRDVDEMQPRVSPVTPATMGGTSAITVNRPIGQIKTADPKAIWLPEEVPSDDEDDDVYETRTRPSFEILYKQSVMTEDVFLGLSDKDPSSAHCEAMVVRVECPSHRRDDIELDVKKQKLLLQSSTLKLSLYLPYPVRHQDGEAKWDQAKQVLTVSLPIIRDEWSSAYSCRFFSHRYLCVRGFIALPMSALAVLEEIHRADPETDRLSLAGLSLDCIDESTLAFLHANFQSIRHLDLRDNTLTTLPSDFGSFVPKLVSLDVRNNRFQSIPKVSEALANCVSLQSLYVTLHNKTDEKVLCVMLPKLWLLNGKPMGDSDRGTRPPLLSLDLMTSPTSCSSSSDSHSPRHRWLDTPPSTTANAVRPVRSPQEKRELRIHFAAAKAESSTTTKLSPSRVQSVKPTELPATISDEKTDWRKLLKQTTAKHQQQKQLPKRHASISQKEPLHRALGETATTCGFIAELKAIVHGFQMPPATASEYPDDTKVLAQLERKIDLLALQLNDLEKKSPTQSDQNNGHVVTASLTARWRLVEAGTLHASHRVGTIDRNLGAGLQRLQYTQSQVVEALLRHVNDAINAQEKLQTAGASQHQVADQQQQTKLLLDVAETLENDLEALQAKYIQEKTQREEAQAASALLQTRCEELKQKLTQQQQQQPPAPMEDTAVTGVQLPRRIRKRHDGIAETTARPVSPRAPLDLLAREMNASAPKPSPPKPPANPPIVRSLTLKQLVDLIHSVLLSKSKYDARSPVIGAPPETVEQHLYTYLNQRFGLASLTIECATAIWKACLLYTRQDNDVAMFHALLRNQVDEDFIGIKKKLQHAVRELLRAYFLAKHPLKSEAVIQQLVDARLHGGTIWEDEWTELLLYLYDPSDSSILMRLVKRKAEVYQNQQQHPKDPSSRQNTTPKRSIGVPFAVFEKLLYDYQLQGRLKLLENFRLVFRAVDSERVGVLTQASFRDLVAQLAPTKSDSDVHMMLARVDSFNHDSVTFSDAVRCLLPDIRHNSLHQRTAAATSSTTRARK